MRADAEGMRRLGLAPDSIIGARLSECGFDPIIRDDGLWAFGPDGAYDDQESPYNAYLSAEGYDADNPWHDYANAGIDNEGNIASGWLYENARRPANIREEDSETPWLTRQMIKFLEQDAPGRERPWMCHLSYIKPHWPYIVPAPYHDMYGPDSHKPVVRDARELENPHPIYAAFTDNAIGQAFRRDDVREGALGAYMGLIKQIDDQMGVLFKHLEASGQLDETMIVITSDHGDYMGDHWLGEKDLFHEPSVKVPLIVYDPSPAADATRGTVCDALVESIDLLPTFVEVAGGMPRMEMLEGYSLLPLLRNAKATGPREFTISEYDYSVTPMAARLGVAPRDARLFMMRDARWKFIHAEGGFAPMLFDLDSDPDELFDLGRDPAYAAVRDACYDKLFSWARRPSQRTTVSDQQLIDRRGKSRRKGIVLGVNTADEIDAELLEKYQGKARQSHGE